MNTARISAVIRWVMTIVGTWLTGKGIVDADTWSTILSSGATIVGALVTLIPIVWSLIEKWRASKTEAK